MNFPKKFWRIPALALVVTLPFVAACADDDGAAPPGQDGDGIGTISGQVTNAETGDPIVGALVGTNPATTTALTDANGNYQIDNVPIPDNPTSYAVTASADGFQSASATTSLSTTAPSVTVNLALEPGGAGTEGDLNVLVVRRTGEPVEGATVTVSDPAGAQVATATTNATGFALFDNLAVGSYTVTATASISGIDFFASGGANVRGGETSFLQLTLGRDFDQSVFPNVDGEPIELTEAADIRFVPVPGQPDDDPLIDCNIIRSQHMFIAEVVDDGSASDPQLVSGVKVQWDLNISTQGICSVFLSEDAFLRCENIPGNTGSVVDSDDPDLDPAVARTGLTPAFNVDTRKAVTFTNDSDQVIAFNNQNVTVGPGQTWIIITSPVEGITDVIAATPDIPASDPECANSGPDQCDKEFAVKRWVNWETRVAELEWDGTLDANFNPDTTGGAAVFDFLEPGQTLSNVLARSEDDCGLILEGLQPAQVPGECELTGNSFLIYADVQRLRDDSPFTLNRGTIQAEITDDQPALEIFGEDPLNDGPGASDGIQNVSNRGLLPAGDPDCDLNDAGNGFLQCDDQYQVELGTGLGSPTVDATDPAFRDSAQGEFFATGGFEVDAPGWVVFEMRLDPAVYFCVDVDFNGSCTPGAAGSTDSFSSAYQQLLDGATDNTNTIAVTFIDEFGEICGDFIFDKEWVASRLSIIKTTPDATVRTVDAADGGPIVLPDSTPRPVKTHTIQVGQEFSYTITVINDGEVASENVRITDTLPRFGAQFFDGVGGDPGDAGPSMRDGHQAFSYVTDRPTFDPVAVVYAVDSLNNDDSSEINFCIRGDNGSTVGNAYVEPAQCFAPDGDVEAPGPIRDVGSVDAARTAAESASGDGAQIVWIQWFDDLILARLAPGGPIETEDTVEVTLVADEGLVHHDAGAEPGDDVSDDILDLTPGYPALPGTWCDIATVTDGPLNLGDTPPHDITDALALQTESLDADTLCHEVREALLEVRKTTQDAVISAGAEAVFTVEIANNGSATLTNTVIEDTLDAALFAADSMYTVTVDTVNFPGATVTQNGRFFTVNIGNLEPTDGFVLAYTVSIATPGQEGLFCNRVTASGDTPAGTISDQDIACVTTTVTIELDVANEDGEIDAAGVFQSAKEQFVVGEGGDDADSLAFVYEISVTNQSAFAATNVEIVDEVAPNTGAIVCRGILATGEGGGANPNVGSVVGGDCAEDGFTWDIGTLDPGVEAVLLFRAEALAAQNDVGNRVNLTADQLTGVIVDEEPTTVTGS